MRIGHNHYGELKLLLEKVISVLKVSTKHDDVSKGCVLEKFTKEYFLRSDTRSKVVLESSTFRRLWSDVYKISWRI